MTDDSPVKPQSEVLYLLGGLNAKMDTVIVTQGGFDSRLQAVEKGLATVQAQQAPRAPWWSIVAGVGSVVAIITAIAGASIYLTK